MRGWRKAVLALVAVAAVGGVVWFAVAWAGRGAEEVSVDEAVRKAGDAGGGTSSSSPEGGLVPRPGVYTYDAEGTEELSLLGTAQDWGDTVPGTVTVGDDGCWELRLDYSTNHWSSQRLCPEGTALVERAGLTFQRFDFVAASMDEYQDFVCDPAPDAVRADARPGDSWPSACTGTSRSRGTVVTSSGENVFVGHEELEIGGVPVDTLHYTRDRELTGDQSGTESQDVWYDARTAMVVRMRREVRVASPSPIGDIVYSERGTLELRSPDPVG